MDLRDFQDKNINNEEYPERLNSFIKYMETMKGSSNNTIISYTMDIIMMLKFIKNKHGLVNDEEFKDIKVNDIDDEFLRKINLDDMYSFLIFSKKYFDNGSSTIARKIASMRAFFKYLHVKLKIIDNDYSIELDKPKIGKRKPKYMNLDEANELLTKVNSRNYERDYLIITLFLNCGMRLAELCSISINDIKDDTIRIIGKGNKERTVYLNQACLRAIDNYLIVRSNIVKEKNIPKEDALILSERGKRIARRTVQEVIEKQLKEAGLDDKGYSTHKLRHTSATLMYKYGNVDILILKEILGHENISTTQIYTHTDNDMLREAVNVNPLNIASKHSK
jgi:site-specific recombinase XerD